MQSKEDTKVLQPKRSSLKWFPGLIFLLSATRPGDQEETSGTCMWVFFQSLCRALLLYQKSTDNAPVFWLVMTSACTASRLSL